MTPANQNIPEFSEGKCSSKELSNVLGFLHHHHPGGRFNDDAKRELRRMIFNLKRNQEVRFAVGQGHTLRATLKNKMVSAGLILWENGYHVKSKGLARLSTIEPTALFFAIVNKFCQLKQGNEHVGYWNDVETLGGLMTFNEFLSQHQITHAHGATETPLRFNYIPNSSNSGAIRQRLIHGIQNVKKTVRPTVQIDGKRSVQFDVTAMHPQLLLHRYRNEPMTFDPYDIASESHDKIELRNAAKLALMMMLNTGSRKSAGAAFRKEIRQQKHDRIRTAIDRYTESQISILDDVHNRNPSLQEFFYKEPYRELMHMEGNIAWACMQNLAAQEILALNVHDEMIVQSQHLKIAVEVYRQCWVNETGANISPKIKIKRCPIDGAPKA